MARAVLIAILSLLFAFFAGCKAKHADTSATLTSTPPPPQVTAATPVIGRPVERHGDEICVCGQLFHTGAPVVLWMDPGGYDAYRVERRFAPLPESSWEDTHKKLPDMYGPNRYGLRKGLSAEQIEKVRGGGWDLALLQQVVDQFVYHFDVAGISRNCFNTLHDHRGLSVHFMLDLDGTIYQTLDLKEQAWHATTSNSRSIGVEIANVGAYNPKGKNPFAKWYVPDASGGVRIAIPDGSDGGIRTPGFVGHPARPEPIAGNIQGEDLIQYDFTPQQYESLIKLTATVCKIFPKLRCDYPRDESGQLITKKLPDDRLKQYQGLIGHYHIQTDKVDPGPALQWDYIVENARKLLESASK